MSFITDQFESNKLISFSLPVCPPQPSDYGGLLGSSSRASSRASSARASPVVSFCLCPSLSCASSPADFLCSCSWWVGFHGNTELYLCLCVQVEERPERDFINKVMPMKPSPVLILISFDYSLLLIELKCEFSEIVIVFYIILFFF